MATARRPVPLRTLNLNLDDITRAIVREEAQRMIDERLAQLPPPVIQAPTLLLTVREAGRELRVSERTVRTLLSAGKLHSVRHGEHQRVTRQELERYIAALPAVRGGQG